MNIHKQSNHTGYINGKQEDPERETSVHLLIDICTCMCIYTYIYTMYAWLGITYSYLYTLKVQLFVSTIFCNFVTGGKNTKLILLNFYITV